MRKYGEPRSNSVPVHVAQHVGAVHPPVPVVPLLAAAGFLRVALPDLHGGEGHRTGLRVLLRQGRFRLAMAVMFVCGAGGAGVAQWLPAYAEQALGFSRETGGYGLLGMALAMTAGRLVAAEWSRRPHPGRWMLAAGGCLMPTPLAALASLSLVGFTAGGLWPGVLAMTANRFPGGGGSLFGFLSAAGNVGCTCMPWTVGLLADTVGLRHALLAVVVPFVVYAALVPLLGRRD